MALLWMRKKKKKKKKKKKTAREKKKRRIDNIARYFIRLGGICFNLLTCGRRSLVSGTQNDTAVS